jgi:hypothetical protein
MPLFPTRLPGAERRHRGRSIAATVAFSVSAALVAGALASPAGAAEVPKPRGSKVRLLMNSNDPAEATWTGLWSASPADIAYGPDDTAADLGCEDSDYLEFAWAPASRDGSAESPKVSDDNTTPAYDAYPWIATTSRDTAPYGTVATADDLLGASAGVGAGNQYLAFFFNAFNLYTKASWPAQAWGFANGTDVGVFDSASTPSLFQTGSEASLVLYCSPGDAADGAPTVRSDGAGHALASWLHVIVGDDPATPYRQDAFTIVGDQVTPTVATEADDVTRHSASLSATLTSDMGSTYADATGTMQWYAGSAVDESQRLGDPVAVKAGVAGPKTVDLSDYAAGSNQDFTAVFTPDADSEELYTASTSEVLTLKVGSDAAATTTTLAVSGSLTAGQKQTLTATVSPATAGTVVFADGATSLGSAPVASGKATLTKALAKGRHSITATFTPSNAAQFAGSASTAQTVTIAEAPAPVVTVAAAAGSYGRVTSVRISATAGGAAANGPVSVTLDGTPLATTTLVDGAATATLPATTPAGTHTLGATYQGASGRQSVVIAKARTAVSVSLKPKRLTRAAAKKGKVKATVMVSVPGTSVSATGTATIKVGKKSVPVSLKGGAATAKLPKKLTKKVTKKLALSVSYAGGTNLAASTTTKTAKVKH